MAPRKIPRRAVHYELAMARGAGRPPRLEIAGQNSSAEYEVDLVRTNIVNDE
jgi:hypothetical protein